MEIRTYNKNAVVFRQGDDGDCMYDIQFGRIGIFDDYGGPDQQKIAELSANQIFGEMGVLDDVPRSATAVALDDGTVLSVIREAEFSEFFEKQPAKVLLLMQQMSNHLRRTTKDYLDGCRAVYEAVEAEKAGTVKSEETKSILNRLAELFKGFNFYAHN